MWHTSLNLQRAQRDTCSSITIARKTISDNIKPELTHLNYNLADEFQPLPQDEFLRKRLGEVRCQRRADVNVMCDWVITKPQDVPENETKKFFQLTFDYLCYRYGEKNVISAYVHMDETTPHLHFSFIPVVPDKKRDGYKVSAKNVSPAMTCSCFMPICKDTLNRTLTMKSAS